MLVFILVFGCGVAPPVLAVESSSSGGEFLGRDYVESGGGGSGWEWKEEVALDGETGEGVSGGFAVEDSTSTTATTNTTTVGYG